MSGAALAAQLSFSSISPSMPTTMPIAVAEVKQGLYKEYSIDKVDDSTKDQVARNYKTAEETEEGAGKV